MNTLRSLLSLSAAVLLLAIITSSTSAVDLTIEAVGGGINGHATTVSVTANQVNFQPGGFDLLLLIDNNRSQFTAARAGTALTDCNWEYFTYRVFGTDSTTAYQATSGNRFIELTGIAAASGGYTPTCYGQSGEMELAQLDFIMANISSGVDVECQFIPVRFFWRNCNDNIIWNSAGDTAHLAFELGEYGVPGPLNLSFPGLGVPGNDCDTMSSRTVVADISALNGGVDLACGEPLYLRGDVNLNGIPYETADAVLLALYFQYGLSVFNQNMQAQIANSDCNADGLPLTVADLVFLLRVIVSDALSVP